MLPSADKLNEVSETTVLFAAAVIATSLSSQSGKEQREQKFRAHVVGFLGSDNSFHDVGLTFLWGRAGRQRSFGKFEVHHETVLGAQMVDVAIILPK